MRTLSLFQSVSVFLFSWVPEIWTHWALQKEYCTNIRCSLSLLSAQSSVLCVTDSTRRWKLSSETRTTFLLICHLHIHAVVLSRSSWCSRDPDQMIEEAADLRWSHRRVHKSSLCSLLLHPAAVAHRDPQGQQTESFKAWLMSMKDSEVCQEKIPTPSTPLPAAAWTVDTLQVVSVDSGCCSQISNPTICCLSRNQPHQTLTSLPPFSCPLLMSLVSFLATLRVKSLETLVGANPWRSACLRKNSNRARHHAAFKVTEITLLNFWCLTPTLTEALDPSLQGCAAPTWLADVLIVLLLKANEPCISFLSVRWLHAAAAFIADVTAFKSDLCRGAIVTPPWHVQLPSHLCNEA